MADKTAVIYPSVKSCSRSLLEPVTPIQTHHNVTKRLHTSVAADTEQGIHNGRALFWVNLWKPARCQDLSSSLPNLAFSEALLCSAPGCSPRQWLGTIPLTRKAALSLYSGARIVLLQYLWTLNLDETETRSIKCMHSPLLLTSHVTCRAFMRPSSLPVSHSRTRPSQPAVEIRPVGTPAASVKTCRSTTALLCPVAAAPFPGSNGVCSTGLSCAHKLGSMIKQGC